MKSIYTYYKERLIEISGRNRSLYIRSFSKKTGYDIGRLLATDREWADEFFDFIWAGRKDKFTILSPSVDSLKKLFGKEESVAPSSPRSGRAKQPFNAALEREATSLRTLRREAEDIEKETGRYELFVGYPFVCGGLRDVVIKAPLLFFPVEVEITESNIVRISVKKNECVRLNKALVFAYAQAKSLDIEELETEFDSLPRRIQVDRIRALVSEKVRHPFALQRTKDRAAVRYSSRAEGP